MLTRRATFTNARGETLSARIDLPLDGRPAAWAVLAHCFTCSKDLRALREIGFALAEEGIGVLRFDFTGLGDSEGAFEQTTFATHLDDLVQACEWLKEHYEAPSLLIGHSLGGAAVLHAAARVPEVKGVVTIASPFEPAHVTKLLGSSREEIERSGEATVRIGGRPFKIRRELLETLENTDPAAVVRGLGKPLLVMHGPLDNVVSVDDARRLFAAAMHPKSFVSLDTADHLLSDVDDARYAGQIAATWARRFVPSLSERRRPHDPSEGQVLARLGGSGFRTGILASGHPIIADEPKSVGGDDLGASPYDLLLASLGACTAMTLRLYADRKEWSLDDVLVRLTHRKVHVEAADGKSTQRLDEITRELELEGKLDETQRQRLLEIANRCPVHRTLEGSVRVITRLARVDEAQADPLE